MNTFINGFLTWIQQHNAAVLIPVIAIALSVTKGYTSMEITQANQVETIKELKQDLTDYKNRTDDRLYEVQYLIDQTNVKGVATGSAIKKVR